VGSEWAGLLAAQWLVALARLGRPINAAVVLPAGKLAKCAAVRCY